MTQAQFNYIETFQNDFKTKIKKWSAFNDELKTLQKNAAEKNGTPLYQIENPVVYNKALDEITETDEIRLIVIGDNPGKNEQLNTNQKYLVGQAGKLAEGFFRSHPELNIDFRKNVIILNKTPVHSAKTNELKTILKEASPECKKMIEESILWMAENTGKLQKNLDCELWLTGYSELKGKGLFLNYRDSIQKSADFDKIFVFQHFSMNRFSIDLKTFMENEKKSDFSQALNELGKIHRNEIFCKLN